MKAGKIESELLNYFSVATIQRLGYILEGILYKKQLASRLWEISQNLGLKFFRQPLDTGKENSGYKTDSKWKIIINAKIDIDE